jgi:hypothetical protein
MAPNSHNKIAKGHSEGHRRKVGGVFASGIFLIWVVWKSKFARV